jgi:hypothetical protein
MCELEINNWEMVVGYKLTLVSDVPLPLFGFGLDLAKSLVSPNLPSPEFPRY